MNMPRNIFKATASTPTPKNELSTMTTLSWPGGGAGVGAGDVMGPTTLGSDTNFVIGSTPCLPSSALRFSRESDPDSIILLLSASDALICTLTSRPLVSRPRRLAIFSVTFTMLTCCVSTPAARATAVLKLN